MEKWRLIGDHAIQRHKPYLVLVKSGGNDPAMFYIAPGLMFHPCYIYGVGGVTDDLILLKGPLTFMGWSLSQLYLSTGSFRTTYNTYCYLCY